MIPKDLNDLSVEFFSSILSLPVESFALDPSIEIKQGNTSSVQVVIVNFVNSLTFPSKRLFLKFAPPAEDQSTRNVSFTRKMFVDAGVYRKEVAFYQHIRSIPQAHDLVPPVYYAEIEEPGRVDNFLIVLGEAGEPLNQLVGCSMDISRSVMSQVAHLHSLFVNSIETAPESLESCYSPGHLLLCQIVYGPGLHTEKTPESLLKHCSDLFEMKFNDLCVVVEASGWSVDSNSLSEIKCHFSNGTILSHLRSAFDSCLISPSFLTLIHGDFRLDNMLFDSQTQKVKFIDFQAVHYGHPAYDLAQFIVQCHEDAHSVVDELLLIYYNTLMEKLPHLNLTFESLSSTVKSVVIFQILLLSFHLAPLKAAINPETGKLPASMDPFMGLVSLITKRAISSYKIVCE